MAVFSKVLSGIISLEHVKLQTIHDCVIRDGRECLITANLIYTKKKKVKGTDVKRLPLLYLTGFFYIYSKTNREHFFFRVKKCINY